MLLAPFNHFSGCRHNVLMARLQGPSIHHAWQLTGRHVSFHLSRSSGTSFRSLQPSYVGRLSALHQVTPPYHSLPLLLLTYCSSSLIRRTDGARFRRSHFHFVPGGGRWDAPFPQYTLRLLAPLSFTMVPTVTNAYKMKYLTFLTPITGFNDSRVTVV